MDPPLAPSPAADDRRSFAACCSAASAACACASSSALAAALAAAASALAAAFPFFLAERLSSTSLSRRARACHIRQAAHVYQAGATLWTPARACARALCACVC